MVKCNTFSSAVENGSMEMVRYLQDKNCPIGSEAYEAAASKGNIKLLEWLLTENIPKYNKLM